MATKKAVNKTENKVDVTKAKKSVKKAEEDVKEVAEVIADKVAEEVKDAVDDVKETAGVVADKVAEETKEVVKKAKKAAAKKEIKTSLFVQCFGKEVEEKDMIASVKKAWTKENGKKVGDIKTITLYVKPEEAAVYYVINGTDTGKVEF